MTDTLDIVRDALRREAQAIAAIPLDNPFAAVTETIHDRCRLRGGKLVVTGVGKAGSVAAELGTTFASTGTPAVFLHPLEAVHGDIGLLQRNDVLLMVSNSGETREILELVPRCKGLYPDLPVVCITGKPESTLAKLSDHVLLTGSPAEICPLGMTPTTSTTVMGVIGDVLVTLQMRRIGFTDADYLARHHGGYLGTTARAKVASARTEPDPAPMVGAYRADYSPLAVVDIRRTDADLAELEANSRPAGNGVREIGA
jgi:arabinose-5-phosphate isomerase